MVVGVLLVGVLSDREPRLTGSNAQIRVSGRALPIAPDARRCQRDYLPARTGSLRVFLGVRGGTAGPLGVTVERADGSTAHARVPAGTPAGAVDVSVESTIEEANSLARICFANRGPRMIELAGDRTPFIGGGANPTSALLDDDVRVDFLRPVEESWWSLGPRVAQRFGLTKTSFSGPWMLWAVLVAVLLIAVCTVALLLRTLRTP